MKFEVKISPSSKLIVDADPSGDGPIEVERFINLSNHNLFVHPFSYPGDEALTPVKDKTIEVFRLLGFADTQNPLLKTLEKYYSVRLPFILNQLEQPRSYNEAIIQEKIATLGSDHRHDSELLRSIVQRIDAEFPLAHRIERAVGTHSWLASGGNAPLPFTPAPLSLLPEYSSLYVPAKRTNAHIPFAIEDGVAFLPAHRLPRPYSIISSLCRTGKGGSALDAINHAAAMAHMTRNLSRDITKARDTVARLGGLLSPATQGFLGHTTMNILLGVTSASLVFNTANNALTLGGGFSDLSVIAAGGALGLGAFLSQRVAKRVLSTRRERDDRRLSRAESLIEETETVSHSVLASVMLNHISKHNIFSDSAFPGPEAESRWSAIFEGLGTSDNRINHLLTLIPLEPYHGDDEDFWDIQERIFKAIEPEGMYLSHVEAAEVNAQLLLAIDAANFFADLTGLSLPPHAKLPMESLLSKAQELRCDSGRVFPLIASTFENLCRSLQLSREDWAFASRPLYAVRVIEAAYMAQRAREIAVEAVLRA
jgi:hypothetical protein